MGIVFYLISFPLTIDAKTKTFSFVDRRALENTYMLFTLFRKTSLSYMLNL